MGTYIYTSQISSLNENKWFREDASRRIKSELEKLQKVVSTDANEDMREIAFKLSKQFMEEKNIDCIVEVKEEDYITELEKIKIIYEYAEEEYTKYIEVSIPKKIDMESYFTKESELKKESVLSTVAGVSMMFLIGLPSALGIIDLITDKYKRYKHTASIVALIGSILFTIFFFWIAM